MEPKPDSPPSSMRAEAPTSSLVQPPRDVNVDPSPLTSAPDSTIGVNAPTPAASPEAEEVDLENQSKEFLLQRLRALERQLKIRNSDCARLLSERQQLLPLRDKCESQKEMILALKGQLDLARAQRESAVDEMETMKRRQRNQEHRDRIQHAERAMYGTHVAPPPAAAGSSSAKAGNSTTATISVSSVNGTRRVSTAAGLGGGKDSAPPPRSSLPNLGRRNPGGAVVNTAAGPQLLYDSSDISSVGFTKNARLPYDFLGGPGAQQQYLARYSGGDRGDVPDGGVDASEDAEVRRVLDTAKDQAEMEAKYAEMEDKEEQALMARIKALRENKK